MRFSAFGCGVIGRRTGFGADSANFLPVGCGDRRKRMVCRDDVSCGREGDTARHRVLSSGVAGSWARTFALELAWCGRTSVLRSRVKEEETDKLHRQSMSGGLKGPSWLLLVLHTIWSCAIGLEMYKLWKRRKTMRIFARSPGLALVSGFGGLAAQTGIVVQGIMTQEGKVFPCFASLYFNPVIFALYALPYLLRGLRVVILSHKVWRAKHMGLLSRRNVAAILGITFMVLNGVCAMLQHATPQLYGKNPTEWCFFLGDWWFWGALGAVTVMVSARLLLELARLHDKINMAKEILRIACTWVACFALYFPVLMLGTFDVLELPWQLSLVVLWPAMATTQIITFVIEPRRRHGDIPWWRKKKLAVIVDDARAAAWRGRWHNSQVIMSDPALDQAFEKHAQDYLCSESYDFIKEVGCYVDHAEQIPPEDRFAHFRNIANVYILAGSKLEINIGTAMRQRVLEIGDRVKFLEATFERQRDVCNPPKMEITKMIDENLVRSFWTRQLFLDACKDWEEQQGTEASTTLETGTLADEVTPFAGVKRSTLVQQAMMKLPRSKRTPPLTNGAERAVCLD